MEDEDSLLDELTSINSIYGDDTLTMLDASSRTCALRFPARSSVVLEMIFPETYPEAPPSIVGIRSVGSEARKGIGKSIVDKACQVLAEVYRPGEPCIFDLIEEVNSALEELEADHDEHADGIAPEMEQNVITQKDPDLELGLEPPWIVAPAITEKKSVFLGRVAAVHLPAEVDQYLRHLLATDKRIAKATHNMVAYRIKGQDGTSYQDCDDDGESAAGSRMLHLLQLMDVWDVVVVVSRWYGGVHLGPSRFQIINNAARDALQLAGYKKEAQKKGKK